MRKVTKRLLTVAVAMLALGACQDSVTVVQPEPPPPPPPPPTVDATVTIQGLRAIPANTPVNPTAVAGDINVVLNVEEGTNTVTDVSLTFDGNPIGCQSISTSGVPGDQVSLSQTGGADVVECFFNSDDVQGACEGDQLDPSFPNGAATLGANITLSDGTTRTAANTQSVTLVNGDFLMLVHQQGSQSVVTGGVTYFGGPADPDGDGTDDNLNSWAVCPVSYAGTTVASLGLQGLQPATNAVDIGAGPGATMTDAAAPFVFDADPTDNDLASGNPVEDDVTSNGLTGGHVMATAGTILDDGGLNVTSQFTGAATGETFLDFTAPVPNTGGASEITIDGASVVAGSWYSLNGSAAGAFGLTNVAENGVGWSFGSGASVDVGDCSVADNNDTDPTTAFVTVVADAMGMADHPEDDWENGGDGFGGTDAGGLDCYLAELQALADDLQNAFDLSTLAATIQNMTADVGADADLDSYGVDVTAPAETNVLPASLVVLNPDANADGGVCADAGDCTVMYDVADPDLASADPGSGVNAGGIAAEDETGAALGGAFVAPTASIDISGLADGMHTVTNTIPDNAVVANELEFDIAFDLDDTAPTHGALNPAPIGGQTAATAIVFTIGGTIDDAHIIDSAVLSVWISDGLNTVCGDGGDTKLTVGTGQDTIDRNDIDLTDGTGNIAFNESFTVQEIAGGVGIQEYCFLITAEDEAVLKDGTDTGNSSMLGTFVTVDWL